METNDGTGAFRVPRLPVVILPVVNRSTPGAMETSNPVLPVTVTFAMIVPVTVCVVGKFETFVEMDEFVTFTEPVTNKFREESTLKACSRPF
jgi:hypothetical protein